MKNKAPKLTARLAADLMKLVGTAKGERRYPAETYMKANVNGLPTFARKELIMHYEIKSWFSRQSSSKK